MSQPDAESPIESTPRKSSYWWFGGLVLTIGIVAQAALWYRYAEDPTYSKMSVLFVWPATLFVLALWWIFLVRIGWPLKLAPFAAVAGGLAVFFSLYKVVGSDGNMVPIFVSRWAPTSAEVARDYWKQQSVGPALTQTTAEAGESQAALDPLQADIDDWPDFRGPARDGIIRGTGFRTDWESRPPQELWRHPVGLGWSSFAVLGDFAITMEQRDERESVVCYSLASGEPLWIHGDVTRFQAVAVNGGDGPHATPAIVGDQTFTLGATGILNALETRTGRVIWTRNILDDAGTAEAPAKNLEWGVSNSPLVVGGLVITIPGGTEGKSVIAYRCDTGDVAWSGGTFPASYGAARVETLGEVEQVIVPHGLGMAGFDLTTGKLLWDFPWENMPKVNAAQPLKVGESSLVLGTGYGIGAVRVDLSRTGDEWAANSTWKSTRFKLKFNDAVLVNNFLYGLDDGIMTCLDPETGKTKWKAQRFGYGQLLAFEDHLLVLSEDGDAVLVQADPQKYREQGRIHVLDGTTWNHPVVAHGRLLVRNGTMAACYDVSP